MNAQGVNSNINFGMALHMEDLKAVKGVLGRKVAYDMQAAKPALEEIAKDVDIFVKPSRYVHSPVLPKNYINIVVQQKNVTFKDKVKRMFSLRPPYKQEDFIPASMSSCDRILESAKRTKKNLMDFIA